MTAKEFFEKYPDYIDAMKTGKKCRFWDGKGEDVYIGYPLGFNALEDKYCFMSDNKSDAKAYDLWSKYEVIKQVPYLKSMTECMRWIEDNGGKEVDLSFRVEAPDYRIKIVKYPIPDEDLVSFYRFLDWNMCGKPANGWYPEDLIEWRDE